MDVIYVLAISVLLQFTAAFLALRLIQITRGRIAWILIATAISLMAIRRSITLIHLVSGEVHPPDMKAEVVALVTSALLVIGVALIAPIFQVIKHSETTLRKINRDLKVLTMTNQVIIRATEEAALLKDVCRTIAEVGGYRLVWVGFAEQDEEKTVRPIAYAGHEEGYLDTVNITWADTERGRGPTGKAILTGKPCVVKDIRTDPDYGHYRDEAVKRGYASLISLPLIANNKTLGALNIYAMETDAFDIEEVNLLTELANDMAFGIMSLCARSDQKFMKEELDLKAKLLDITTDSIFLHDLEGNFIYVNEAAYKTRGYTKDEFLKINLRDLDTPEYAKHIKPRIKELTEKGKLIFESAHFRKDKSIMPIEVNACLIEHGGKKCILSAARDITEYKRAESALHKSEEELKKKFKELEEFYNMAVGRELRMIELKEEIENLREELERYKNL